MYHTVRKTQADQALRSPVLNTQYLGGVLHPVYNGDHMSLQGGLLHKKDIRSFYLDMLSMIRDAG